MRTKLIYVLLPILCGVLIILHGIEAMTGFRVDTTTIFLLIIAALPVIGKYIESVRSGNLEIRFRQLSLNDQIFVFLEGVARQRLWTYYIPRGKEMHLGDAFRIMVEEVNRHNHPKLMDMLRKFMQSGNDNLRWFASENIGYFKFEELKELLPPLFNSLDKNIQWAEWQLNCLWAYSRFENYQSLRDFLMNTRNKVNQIWLLEAYKQMPMAGHAEPNDLIPYIRRFINRKDVSNQVLQKAHRIIEELEKLDQTKKIM